LSNDAPGFRVSFFGTSGVVGPDGERHLSPFQTALVSLVYAEGSINRPEIARTLWQAAADHTHRQRIRQLRHGIKRKLGDDALAAKGDVLLPREEYASDLRDFRTAIEGGQLVVAVRLLRAGFLQDLDVGISDPFDDWRDTYAASLDRKLRSGIATTWQTASTSGDWGRARDAAEAMYLLEPSDAVSVVRVIEARARMGKPRSAESAYAEYCDSLSGADIPADVEALIERVRSLGSEDDRTEVIDTPFVGRQDSLARLAKVVSGVRDGSFSFALIVGESGIGKTRLLAELERTAHLEGVRCLRAQPVELERRITLNPILDALSDVDIEPHLDALGEPWRTVIGTLLPADSLTFPVGRPPPIEETALSRRLLDAVSLLLERLAAEQPTILFLDDLQWADATTIAALQFFQRRWGESAFGVIAAARPELIDPKDPAAKYLAGDGNVPVTQIELGELGEEDAQLLVGSLSQDRLGDATTKKLFELAGLNPLYLTELTRDFLADRLHFPEKPEDSVSIPISLREIVAARTHSLTKETMAVANLLAVGAKPMRLSDIAAMLNISLDLAADAADNLSGAGLAGLDRDRVWIRHDLFRSALYGEMSEARRAVLHRKHAEHIGADGSEESAGSLSVHYDHAGEAELAASHGWTAGERAMERGAVAEAAHFFEVVTRNEADPPRRAIATARLATALHLNRDIRRANPALELASTRLRAAGMPERARRMDIRRVEGLSEAGDTPTEDLIERLGAIKGDATEAEDWEAVALALDVELKLQQMAGNLEGVRTLRQQLQGIITRGEELALLTAHLVLALSLLQEDPEEAVASAHEAVALSRRVSPDWRLTALNRLLIVFYHRGLLQLPESQTLISEARALAENSGDLLQRVCFESNMGAWHLDAGDLDRAEVLIGKADRLLGSADMTFTRINLACNLGELAIARGDFRTATASFESAGSHEGLTIPRYTSNFVNAGLGLCALEMGSLSQARRYEQELDEPPLTWSYDPTVIVAFRSRLLERRGQGLEAIELLSLTAESLKDRLVMAWLKIRAMEVRLLLKVGAPEADVVASEGLELSKTLRLDHRVNEFSTLLEEARAQ